MQFSKWHGLGNDYLLVERAELDFALTPERVRKLCDRTGSILADEAEDIGLPGSENGGHVAILGFRGWIPCFARRKPHIAT